MLRSLQGRLIVLLTLLAGAAVAAGLLMVGLFQQSATAQIGQADAQNGRACDVIAEGFRFYSTGWHGANSALDDARFRSGLATVVQAALRSRSGVEGGLWQHGAESLAYAFPTYAGSGPKTDLPQAELPRIRAVNQAAIAQEHTANARFASPSQTLLLTACPVSGPIPELTAWTMTRVNTFGGRAYSQLMAGLVVLLATVLTAAVLLTRLTLTWSRHVARIEATLATHDIAELPTLPRTGERELDRIVMALNDAGVRLAEAQRRSQALAHQVAAAERLSAMGRVVAGVAHEIRNPIAAMRLKAENALAGGSERYRDALSVMIGQIGRLERVVRSLLDVSERDHPHREIVLLNPFVQACIDALAPHAQAKSMTVEHELGLSTAFFDPEQMRRALDNLLLNAIQAAPPGSRVAINAFVRDKYWVLSVEDAGPGPPLDIRDHLFEPFVTGRPDGTGLGLSIVREIAHAHGGTVRCVPGSTATVFEMVLPCTPS